MIGITEILVLIILALNLIVTVWSFTYVVKKSDIIKKRNPYAFNVWIVVVIHIFIIIFVDSIGGYLLSILIHPLLAPFIHPISCLILPIYLKRKYK